MEKENTQIQIFIESKNNIFKAEKYYYFIIQEQQFINNFIFTFNLINISNEEKEHL